MFKLCFRKDRGTRDQIPNICWIIKKAREFQKNIYVCFIDYAKAFDCVDCNKLEISERDGNTRPPDLPLEKLVCRSGRTSENWTWKNRLYVKAAYYRPAYLTYMQSTSCEMLGWMNTSWNQDCQEKYQKPQICR